MNIFSTTAFFTIYLTYVTFLSSENYDCQLPAGVRWLHQMKPIESFTYNGHMYLRYPACIIIHDYACPCLDKIRDKINQYPVSVDRDNEIYWYKK